MTFKRRTVIYGIGGVAGAVSVGVAARFFGPSSIEFLSWLAGIGSLAVAVLAARQMAAARPPAPVEASPQPDAVGARPGEGGTDAHVQIIARAWKPYLERRGVSGGLLRGVPARELSRALAALDDLAERTLPEIDIAIRTAYRPRNITVRTAGQLWSVLLVDSILSDGGIGLQRWLLRETDRILQKEPLAVPRLCQVWQSLFDTYLSSAADQPETGLMRALVTGAITQSGHDHKRLYPIVSLLIEIARDDPPALRHIREALKEHDRVLREHGSGPATLKRVQLLLGKLGAAVGPVPFNPDLVTFPAGAGRPYPFQAMRFPLTAGDVNSILRRSNGAAPAMPHVLSQERTDATAFGGMWRELSDILGALPRPADHDDWRWDIPTVAEWIVLSGCDTQLYPWGPVPPTPLHANLKFEPGSRLSPVGTYVAGKSRAGIYDCCGGVHEIVRELPHERFETDDGFESAFRLAGGSYQSPPHGVTGQRFRHLSPRDRAGRPSCVGIRLIAYRERDEALRWELLRDHRVRRQQPRPRAVTATASPRRPVAGRPSTEDSRIANPPR